MKKIYFYLIGILILASCTPGKYTKWGYNKSINSIKFEKIKYYTTNNEINTIIGVLAENQVINDYPCAKDWIYFTKDWKPKMFRLSENHSISGVNIPVGSWIWIDSNQDFSCVFPKDTVISNFKIKGGGGVTGIQTAFYKSGKLKSFYSEDNSITIDGVVCKCNLVNNIGIFENGKLEHCKIDQKTVIDGKTYQKNTSIYLDENGKVIVAE